MLETTTTKTARHTPGPWKVFDDTDPPVVGIILPDGRPLDLCDVIAQPDDDETAANARLIAAAPDLLRACQKAERNLSPLYCSEHVVMVALRAAIARATGN